MSRRRAIPRLALLVLAAVGPLACATAGGAEHQTPRRDPYYSDSIHYDTWPGTYQWRGNRPYARR
ncbi:MAG: hypothetical protein OEM05_16150 [Myxococcales bacterium]|nr:hypothetical protein [Myxococcales bacterium]